MFNLTAMSTLGTLVEIRRGSLRFAGLVLITAIVSNIGQYLYMERVAPGDLDFRRHLRCDLRPVWLRVAEGDLRAGAADDPAPQQHHIRLVLDRSALCMTGVLGPIANAAHVVGLGTGITLGVLRYQ